MNIIKICASLTQSTLKRLHGSTNSRLQLNYVQPIIQRLVVDNDLHVKRVLIQNALDGCRHDGMNINTVTYNQRKVAMF